MTNPKQRMNKRFADAKGGNIFTHVSMMASEHDAINLSQGFNEEDGPQYLRDIVADNFRQDGVHQYSFPNGHPDLRNVISNCNKHYYNLDTDPDKHVMVTTSATLALHIALWILLEQGDEVIAYEPFYNFYDPMIRSAGGIPRYVKLSPPEWPVIESDLRKTIGPKTKVLILNSPMNPNGKVFSREELDIIARVAKDHNLIVICDEVYEFLTNPDHPHIPLATLPGMSERVIRISSPGKTFSFTGWRVGYLSAPEEFIPALTKAHTLTTFCVPLPLQMAVARGLQDHDFIARQGHIMKEKADYLASGLSELGFAPLPYQGGFFLCADYRDIAHKIGFKGNSLELTEYLTKNAGITPMPLDAFYEDGQEKNTLLRFCVAKKHSTLANAIEALKKTVV